VPQAEIVFAPTGDDIFPLSSGERERKILTILFILSNPALIRGEPSLPSEVL
jgi:hypothetical protein